jgi:CRISPR-associated protein Cst1
MLNYTGHPLVDVGVATILAFSRKSSLSKVTEHDLDKIADYIAAQYVVNPLKSFLNVAFPNSGFTQPAFEKEPERRQDYARRVARSYKADVPVLQERCVFTGEPAVAVAFSDKEGFPEGRAFRQHVPMLTGEEVINFHPGGDAGLPVSGKALLCIQTFPLGCAKCGGKLLAVHSDNSRLMERFAAEFLQANRAMIDIAREKDDSKLPERGSAKTLLIHTLLEIETKRQDAREEGRPCSVTAYHLSNSGQSNPLDARNPPLEIYYLPLEIISFLEAITSVTYRAAWQMVERRAWQLTKEEVAAQKETKGKKRQPKAKKEAVAQEPRPRRNFLYEDLFNLPHNAPTFMRRYFLRLPARNTYDDDPRRSYSLKSDASLVSWQLTQLFLERIMQMKTTRIDRIREMGEQLAQYVHDENDTKFFQRFYSEQRRYDLIRNELIRVNNERLKRKQPPLVRFEPYVEVFEDVDDKGRTDWRLARDLVLIRMIEKLYELRWIEQHPDAIPEARVEDEGDEKSAE